MPAMYCPNCGFHPFDGASCSRCGFATAPIAPAAGAPTLPFSRPEAPPANAAPATMFFHPGGAAAPVAPPQEAPTASGAGWQAAAPLFDPSSAPPPPQSYAGPQPPSPQQYAPAPYLPAQPYLPAPQPAPQQQYAPGQPAPQQYAPAQPVPQQYAPAQPVPQQYAPAQPAPQQYAPAQPVPQQYAPAQPAPQQYAPQPQYASGQQYAPQQQYAPAQPVPQPYAPAQPYAPGPPAPQQYAPVPQYAPQQYAPQQQYAPAQPAGPYPPAAYPPDPRSALPPAYPAPPPGYPPQAYPAQHPASAPAYPPQTTPGAYAPTQFAPQYAAPMAPPQAPNGLSNAAPRAHLEAVSPAATALPAAAAQSFGSLGPVNSPRHGNVSSPNLGPAPASDGSWNSGGLSGANAMMPPDEEEELAMEGTFNRRPSAVLTGAATDARMPPDEPDELVLEPLGTPAGGDAPPPSRSAPAQRGPLADPQAPGRPAQPTPPGAKSGAPTAPMELASIPLATEREPINAPVAVDQSQSGEHCKRCGTRVYQSMMRCPNCHEPQQGSGKSAAQRSASRLAGPGPRQRARSTKKLIAAVVVTAVVLGGAAFAVFHASGTKDAGAATADETVRGFFEQVLDGQFRESLRFVHPDQHKHAVATLDLLEQRRTPGDKIIAAVVRASGVGRIDLVVEKTVLTGNESGKVELLFRRDGLPMRRATLPVRSEGQRWFIATNPYVGIP